MATTVARPRTYLFSFLGLRRGHSLCYPVPQSLRKLEDRIRDAVMSVDGDMLCRVWVGDASSRWDNSRHVWKPNRAHVKKKLECFVATYSQYVT